MLTDSAHGDAGKNDGAVSDLHLGNPDVEHGEDRCQDGDQGGATEGAPIGSGSAEQRDAAECDGGDRCEQIWVAHVEIGLPGVPEDQDSGQCGSHPRSYVDDGPYPLDAHAGEACHRLVRAGGIQPDAKPRPMQRQTHEGRPDEEHCGADWKGAEPSIDESDEPSWCRAGIGTTAQLHRQHEALHEATNGERHNDGWDCEHRYADPAQEADEAATQHDRDGDEPSRQPGRSRVVRHRDTASRDDPRHGEVDAAGKHDKGLTERRKGEEGGSGEQAADVVGRAEAGRPGQSEAEQCDCQGVRRHGARMQADELSQVCHERCPFLRSANWRIPTTTSSRAEEATMATLGGKAKAVMMSASTLRTNAPATVNPIPPLLPERAVPPTTTAAMDGKR